MATTNVVRTAVGNSPVVADSAKGAGAGAEDAIATPMLEIATAATKRAFAGATILHITELSSGFAGTRYKQES
ncbi:hypothetical protein R1sor_022767 [Riccia sorocarpa]|uniref:Uncharacterized protein n=1 Tax=Riccia sorocarpa TaxID=122646 RepID=A0ABD3GPP9_9MARC